MWFVLDINRLPIEWHEMNVWLPPIANIDVMDRART